MKNNSTVAVAGIASIESYMAKNHRLKYGSKKQFCAVAFNPEKEIFTVTAKNGGEPVSFQFTVDDVDVNNTVNTGVIELPNGEKLYGVIPHFRKQVKALMQPRLNTEGCTIMNHPFLATYDKQSRTISILNPNGTQISTIAERMVLHETTKSLEFGFSWKEVIKGNISGLKRSLKDLRK